MTAKKWKAAIKKKMLETGVFKPAFEKTVETLADILEQRDRAYADFLDSGGEFLITKISDRGAVNAGKNPLLVIWMDLNTQALAYWRDLGLTPAGLRKIDESAVKISGNKDSMESILAGFGL